MNKIILNTADSPLNRTMTEIDTNFRETQSQLDDLGNIANSASAAVSTLVVDAIVPTNPVITSITESGYVVDGVLFSEVTATYTSPNPIGNFKGVYFVVKNYRGSAQLIKESEHNFAGNPGGSATFNVTLQRTGETITVYLVPKNNFGVSPADWTTAPSTTVVLDGNASAPNAPTGLAATSSNTGIALSWNNNAELNLSGYKLYRNTVNTFGSATVIANIGVTLSGGPSFFDNTGSYVAIYYYWVTAVNTANQESPNSSVVSAISGGNAVTGVVVQGNFGAATTTTTITLYYDGTNSSNQFTLRLPGGATKSVPTGSTAITGLIANNTYKFYGYYDVLTDAVAFVTGGSGSPAIAFATTAVGGQVAATVSALATASSATNDPGRIGLASTSVSISTPAAGTGGGTGGGSGDPSCLAPWMELETKDGVILAEDLEVGDSLWTPEGWSEVVKIKKPQQDMLVKVRVATGAVIECSPTHPISLAKGGWRYAAELVKGDYLITEEGASEIMDWQVVPMKYVSIHPSLEPHHSFFCNGILTHNNHPSKY